MHVLAIVLEELVVDLYGWNDALGWQSPNILKHMLLASIIAYIS